MCYTKVLIPHLQTLDATRDHGLSTGLVGLWDGLCRALRRPDTSTDSSGDANTETGNQSQQAQGEQDLGIESLLLAHVAPNSSQTVAVGCSTVTLLVVCLCLESSLAWPDAAFLHLTVDLEVLTRAVEG